MRDLTTLEDLNALLREPVAVLLKHGARCPVSAAARDAVAGFGTRAREVPVAGLEVTALRELSDFAADRLATPHESPQCFVLAQGRVRWIAQHRDITTEAIAQEVARAAQGAGS